MKHKFFSICLMFVLFTQCIFANPAYNTTLNNIPYTTEYPIIEQDDMTYISLTDFATMALLAVEVEAGSYILTTANGEVLLNPNSRIYEFANKDAVLSHAPLLVNEQLYLPAVLLSDLGYTCTFDTANDRLDVVALAPYSRNSDNPTKHLYKETKENLKVLPKHTIAFSSPEEVTTLIDAAIADKSYIAFVDNVLLNSVQAHFTPKLEFSPYDNMSVTFRLLDTHATPNAITQTITLPLKVNFSKKGTELIIGEERFIYPLLWATYYPKRSLTLQDIPKTAETTIMRGLYEYYRNITDLRDDQYFSPFTIISSERTNTLTHGVYSLNLDQEETHYDVVVYRVHSTGAIHYIVDVIAK